MSISRGMWLTFAAIAIVLGVATAGYVARAEFIEPSATETQPTAVNELPPLEMGTVEVPGPSASAITVPAAGTGKFATAGGGSSPIGSGRIYRYLVVVEEGAGVPPDEFAAAVERTLAEPRGWTASRKWGFQRVSGGSSDVTVHLATPKTTDRLCDSVGVETRGEVSCRGGRTVVINLGRWLTGVPHYTSLDDYRHMVVNHEMGHFLGHGHVKCGRAGTPAPVMQRQTFGLEGCTQNPWPFPDQRNYVTGPYTS
ncbi:DUF3152 domain-containing protein [Virgisporangium ochraceum]|nr:DUF3152 domain-containing protein [Virgisporangium ochraceum]